MALETIKYNPASNMQSMSVIAQSMQGNSQFVNQYINSAINRTSFIDQMHKEDDNNFVQEQQNNIANERAERFDGRNRMEFAMNFGRQLDRDAESDKQFDKEYYSKRDDEYWQRGNESIEQQRLAENDSFDKMNTNRTYELDKKETESRITNDASTNSFNIQVAKLSKEEKQEAESAQMQINKLKAQGLPPKEYNEAVNEILAGVSFSSVKEAITKNYVNQNTGKDITSSTAGVSGSASSSANGSAKERSAIEIKMAELQDSLRKDGDGNTLPEDQYQSALNSNSVYNTYKKQLARLDGDTSTPTEVGMTYGEKTLVLDQANKLKAEAKIPKKYIDKWGSYASLYDHDPSKVADALKKDGYNIRADKGAYKSLIESMKVEKKLHTDVNGKESDAKKYIKDSINKK